MKGISKNGTEILGTLDRIEARAEIASFDRNPDGSIEINWDGYTEVFWDSQRTQQDDAKDLYLDREGETFTEDEIAFVDDDFDLDEAMEDARRAEDGPTDDEIFNGPGMEGGVRYGGGQ